MLKPIPAQQLLVPRKPAPVRLGGDTGLPAQQGRQAWALLAHLLTIPSSMLTVVGSLQLADGPAIWPWAALIVGATGTAGCTAYLTSRWRRGRQDEGRLTSALQDVAHGAGDLTVRLPVSAGQEAPSPQRAFNDVLNRMNSLVWLTGAMSATLSRSSDRLVDEATTMSRTSQQVSDAVTEVARGAGDQAAVISDSAADIESLSQSALETRQHAAMAADAARKAAGLAETGSVDLDAAVDKIQVIHDTVNDTAAAVRHLGELGGRIGDIVQMIQAVAAQTNLLSLNAAIEAARAGEHGRGFAVVADEVRKLANQSAVSARQITALATEIDVQTRSAVDTIDRGTGEVEEGVSIIQHCRQAFSEIAEASGSASQDATAISGAVTVLVDKLNTLSEGMSTMAATSEEMAAAAEEVSASTQEQTAAIEQIAQLARGVNDMAGTIAAMVANYLCAAAVWSDVFVTRIELIDRQHRGLFDAINAFGDAIKAGKGFDEVDRLLGFLRRYTDEHFTDEEILMQRYDYPQLPAHKAMHATFVRKIDELIEKNRRGEILALFEASAMMVDWLQNHIREVDIKGYVPFVRERLATAGHR